MKLSMFTLIIGAAGLAAAEGVHFAAVKTGAQVDAPQAKGAVIPVFSRIGLAGAGLVAPTMADPIPAAAPKFRHRPSCGGFKAKAVSFSNWLRIKLGFDKDGNAHVETTVVRVTTVGPAQPHPHPQVAPSLMPYGHAHMHAPTFAGRIHRALTSLGPWEGRAVAFVLGCGIGVLLRMFFVLAVLSVRAIRSRRESNVDYYSYEELERDGAEIEHAHLIFVAPPEYADEKAPISA
jgi:hypothetical protein